MAISATAFIAAARFNSAPPPSECEAVETESRSRNENREFLHGHYHESSLALLTAARSPSSSPAMIHAATAHQLGNIGIESPAKAATTRRWWRLRLWRRSSPPHQSSGEKGTIIMSPWWKRIGQTVFVMKRGMEIVVRLSPLLILVPTAAIVSYINPIWRRHIQFGSSYTEPEVLTINHEKDDDMLFAEQFQESNFPHHHRTSTWASDLAWMYTLHTLQCLGPAFVKLGQWAATRRDLFPVHICNGLSELHDTARIHAWRHTHEALVDAFGEDYESNGLIVAKNDEARDNGKGGGILGSGSAAQVHRGTLITPPKDGSDNNQMQSRTVAVKVLHPNTRQLVDRDLALMQHIADFIEKSIPFEVVKMLSLPRAVSNFADVMSRQVDLRVEGDNLRTFRENFGCTGYSKDDVVSSHPPAITFPRPEPGWVAERVLVEEHAGDAAVPISRYLADDSPEGLKTREILAGPLLRSFLKMVFVDNFIHSDLHPGNVLVRAVPNKSNPKRVNYTIVFLDAGIATSLQSNDKKNLRDLFKAVVLNDGYNAGILMVERARYERCTAIPGGKHAFASGVADIVSEFHDRRKQGLTLGAVRVGALLGQVLDLCRRYSVEIDPAMSSVVVSMLVLEGLGRSLDPNLNLMKAAVPFLLGRGKV